MKRKEIIVLIGEVLGSRAVYSVASLVITITMLSGITIILRNDIRDIKNYVQSVVDGDPNYKEIHSQVSSSDNVIRGNIDVEALLAKDDKETETTSTASNISSGYDNYTPTQTVTDDSGNKPSNGGNNSTSGGTSIANNGNSNNSNNTNSGENPNNNNSSESKKEEILDRSSFNGKDIMISEGEPFNPMNGLQLAATDINGKNITNKIVIKENNVDTYKPGLYSVKATVELSDKSNLEKEFFVRVEPTELNLIVNDVRASKDILEKNEEFNLSFAVKTSKSYLEVVSVNINNKDYTVNKVSSSSFFRNSDKYQVDLVAPSKGGLEKIGIKSVTMSDGTIIDVNKNIEVEILKEEAKITDVIIKNISNENENILLEYNLKDVDNTIDRAFLYLYDENDIIIQQEELEKNNKSYINLNINENGIYKVQIKGYYKENINITSDFYNEKELFHQNLEINKFNNDDVLESDYDLALMSMDYEKSDVNYSIDNDYISEKERSVNSTEQINEEKIHEIKVTGSVANNKGEFPQNTLHVVVPTIANFTINKDGDFIASNNFTIINNGSDEIDVIVQKFIDTTGIKGINIQGEEKIQKNDLSRNNISLNINGNMGTAYLGSDKSTSGVYLDPNLNKNEDEGVRIASILGKSKETLNLNGQPSKGTEAINEPIQDRFTLILKIKKSEKN